jgi:light-regulated signal transduction histidine kinase (bacteriophytochrome)
LKIVERELAFVQAEYQEYLSAISHDFAGPLRTMTGFSEIILSNNERVFDEDTKQLFGFITAAAADGKAMLDDLRQFSRLHRENSEFEAYDSRTLVHAALDELADLQEPSGINIQVDPLPILYGDKTQMQRVFHELLKNALLYRDDNHNTAISVTAYDQEASVEFRVSDNGIRVPENMDTVSDVSAYGTDLGLG